MQVKDNSTQKATRVGYSVAPHRQKDKFPGSQDPANTLRYWQYRSSQLFWRLGSASNDTRTFCGDCWEPGKAKG